MFNNPGKKIQSLAKVVFWFILIIILAVVVLAVLYAQSLPAGEREYTTTGAVIYGSIALGGGILFAWLNTIFMYGIGSLIEDVEILREQSVLKGEDIQKIDVIQQDLQTLIMMTNQNTQILQELLLSTYQNNELRAKEKIANKMEKVFKENEISEEKAYQ